VSTDLSGTLDAMRAEAERCQREGSLADAIAAYKRLLASWPGLPTCWYELGLLQRKMRDFQGALVSYKEALERQIAYPEEVHLNRGVIFSDFLNDYDSAEREINAALVLNPGYVPALINLANLHEDQGRRERASEVYERLLALNPEAPQILARYAGLKNFRDRDDPFIARMQRALAEPKISVADRASLGFALGRALDACGDYEAAFRAYLSANRDSRASAPPTYRDYDLGEQERLIDRLIAAFPGGPRNAGPQIYSPKTGAPQPIFICGMFRSGSTLTEQLLAGHPQVSAGGELSFLRHAVQTRLEPFPECVPSASALLLESIAVEYVDMLHDLFGDTRFVTDKRPDNFLLIGLIKTLFPAAKIIHTTRDALDNCLSIYFLHLDQAMSYALDLMDIGHYYVQYRRLMAHWKALYGSDILDLSYDHLVADPKPVVNRMLKFLDLSPNENCLVVPPAGRVIKTASVWQTREPLYQRSSGRSKHYQRQLATLQAYLLAN
jgi:tetratricopeptide (TPR) repeat protein